MAAISEHIEALLPIKALMNKRALRCPALFPALDVMFILIVYWAKGDCAVTTDCVLFFAKFSMSAYAVAPCKPELKIIVFLRFYFGLICAKKPISWSKATPTLSNKQPEQSGAEHTFQGHVGVLPWRGGTR